MKKYATNIEVNGDKAYFKDDILTITSNVPEPCLYASYEDGSTSKYGVTVQEVKEAILKNKKIVFDFMETGSGATDRLAGKYFITITRNSSNEVTEEYLLYYINENGNKREIIINFGEEPLGEK